MDAFSYLSVLLSIILGLAMTQVLQGYRALLLARRRVRLHGPTLAWSGYILAMATQMWWASFGLADHRDWSFAAFAILLAQMAFLYMMAGLVLPDMPPEDEIDLQAHYYREVRPFFTLLLLVLASSLVKDWMLDGRLPGVENLLFHGLFATIAAVALATRRPLAHQAVAMVSGVCLAAYVGLLFARLSLA